MDNFSFDMGFFELKEESSFPKQTHRWHRVKVKDYKNGWHVNKSQIEMVQHFSGVAPTESDFQQYIKSLIPGSFGLMATFKLTSPYHSRDELEYLRASGDRNIPLNPVLKEHTWVVPMIRGSLWKGWLFKAAKYYLQDQIENHAISAKKVAEIYCAISRIFGTGSDEFRKFQKEIDNNYVITDLLIEYALFELGSNFSYRKSDGQSIAEAVLEQMRKVKYGDAVFPARRGRLICYPSYFDRVDYEVINLHDPVKRKGKRAVSFETVPAQTRGILQLVYIPFDLILVPESEVTKEAEEDQKLLEEWITKLFQYHGIGAKTKLGWGRGECSTDGRWFYSWKR